MSLPGSPDDRLLMYIEWFLYDVLSPLASSSNCGLHMRMHNVEESMLLSRREYIRGGEAARVQCSDLHSWSLNNWQQHLNVAKLKKTEAYTD